MNINFGAMIDADLRVDSSLRQQKSRSGNSANFNLDANNSNFCLLQLANPVGIDLYCNNNNNNLFNKPKTGIHNKNEQQFLSFGR